MRLILAACATVAMAQIRFEDVTPKSRIDFRLNNGAQGSLYQPELMPGGVAAFDFDNDGCMDLFFANGAGLPSLKKTGRGFHNRLYRGHCDFRFTDVTARSGLAGEGYSMAVAAADYDNDGFTDLFVAGVHRNFLYRNRGDGTFEDVSARAGIVTKDTQKDWSISAAWLDYDRDGRLDLFVSNYVHWDPAKEAPCGDPSHRIYCHPKSYAPQHHRLFRNQGDGTFADVSRDSGIAASPGKGMGVCVADAGNDGWPDVFVANDSVPGQLFNNKHGRFVEAGLEAGVAYPDSGKAIAGMGCGFRDIDGDGRPDVLVTGMVNDSYLLFRNLGRDLLFEDFTARAGLARSTVHLTGWSAGLFDFDNDGFLDLFTANSHFPRLERQMGMDPRLANSVFRGSSGDRFIDVSAAAGDLLAKRAFFRGTAFADFDRDGLLDAVVTALGDRPLILRNVSASAYHWIALALTGKASNRQGLGSRVSAVLPGGTVLHGYLTTSVGYASSSEPLLRFGLGPHSRVASIEIQWPGGANQKLTNLGADQVVAVTEP